MSDSMQPICPTCGLHHEPRACPPEAPRLDVRPLSREALLARLQPFCSAEPGRPALAAPWSFGAHTYASDGRVIVRVPRIEGVPVDANHPGATIASRLFDANPPGPVWYPIPIAPMPPDEPCTKCSGIPWPTCDACKGVGEVAYEFWHNSRPYTTDETCPVCQGVTCCPRCNGTLLEPRAEDDAAVEIGGATFAVRYLRLLAALPECEIAPRGKHEPARVRFGGGEALIMPMRRAGA